MGTTLLQQICGIPMGMNAASFMSNLFLFMFEFEFMGQFIGSHVHGPVPALQREHEINFFQRYFKYIKRYQDDRWAADSKYLGRSLYRNRWWGLVDGTTTAQRDDTHPYYGIYPNCLRITIEQKSKDDVTHQDLRIIRYVNDPTGTAGGNPTYAYRTTLYDKKTDPKYNSTRDYIVKFCDPNTMLPDSSIYGVVYSQVRRYAMRCTQLEDFQAAAIDMVTDMMDMGYIGNKVYSQFSKFTHKYESRYGYLSLKKVSHKVKTAIFGADRHGV